MYKERTVVTYFLVVYQHNSKGMNDTILGSDILQICYLAWKKDIFIRDDNLFYLN